MVLKSRDCVFKLSMFVLKKLSLRAAVVANLRRDWGWL